MSRNDCLNCHYNVSYRHIQYTYIIRTSNFEQIRRFFKAMDKSNENEKQLKIGGKLKGKSAFSAAQEKEIKGIIRKYDLKSANKQSFSILRRKLTFSITPKRKYFIKQLIYSYKRANAVV